MLHIRPIIEDKASEEVRQVYEEIKKTFGVSAVPLVFQYLAGYEEYFLYVWEKIKQNLNTPYFVDATAQVITFAKTAIPTIYRPSRKMHAFLQTLHPSERQHIHESIQELEKVNAQLMLITQGMREGLKGVTIGISLVELAQGEGFFEEEIFDKFINNKIMQENLKHEKELEPASKMLAPLFGSSSMMISKYPEFFSHIAEEMDELVKTEQFLHTRVGLERIGITTVYNLPYSLGTSYQEVVRFAGKKPYFDELLYILSETFPTKFPRPFLSQGRYWKVLQHLS